MGTVLLHCAWLLAGLAGLVVLDLGVGLTVHLLPTAVLAALALLPGLPLLLLDGPRRRGHAALSLGFLAGLGLLAGTDTTPAKPFHRLHAELQPGMDLDEVAALTARHFPEGGRFPAPECSLHGEDRDLSCVLDPTDGRFNAEVIHLRLDAEQRVLAAAYHYD